MDYITDSELENNNDSENNNSFILKQFITNNYDNESISSLQQGSEILRYMIQTGSEKEKIKKNNSEDDSSKEKFKNLFENNVAWEDAFNKKELRRDIKNFWKRNYIKFNKEWKNNIFEEKLKNKNILMENNIKELYWKLYLENLIKYSEEKCYCTCFDMKIIQGCHTLFMDAIRKDKNVCLLALLIILRVKIKIIMIYKLLLNDIDQQKDLLKEMTKDNVLKIIMSILRNYLEKYELIIYKKKDVIKNYIIKELIKKKNYFGIILLY